MLTLPPGRTKHWGKTRIDSRVQRRMQLQRLERQRSRRSAAVHTRLHVRPNSDGQDDDGFPRT